MCAACACWPKWSLYLSFKCQKFFFSLHMVSTAFSITLVIFYLLITSRRLLLKQSTVELPDVCAQNFQCPLVFLACKLKLLIVSENLLAWLVSWIFKSLCRYWKQTHCKYGYIMKHRKVSKTASTEIGCGMFSVFEIQTVHSRPLNFSCKLEDSVYW